RQVDVDETGDAAGPEDARRPARLPDQRLEDLRAGLHLPVGVDPDARHDHALAPDRDLVADRDALVDAHVRTEVARPADDRAFDDRRAPDRRRAVDNRPRDLRALAQRHARREHGVRADGRVGGDAAVVAEICGTLERVEVVQVDAVADPDVAANADARDVEPHAL